MFCPKGVPQGVIFKKNRWKLSVRNRLRRFSSNRKPSNISKNQNQAAKGLGFNKFQTYVYVIYPQVLKTVFLPMTNQFIWAMMGTSLGIIIGLQELTGMTTFLQSQTFRPFEFYFIAALIYIVISKSILLGSGFIAKRYLRIWIIVLHWMIYYLCLKEL